MGSNIRRKIILASASPRRKELLTRAEVKFDICLKSVDETVPEGMNPVEGAEHTAAVKAMAVSFINSNAIVIGADTVVVLGDEVLGKPVGSDEENQKSTLVSLLGIERCKELVREYTSQAVASLYRIGGNTKALSFFAMDLAKRVN